MVKEVNEMIKTGASSKVTISLGFYSNETLTIFFLQNSLAKGLKATYCTEIIPLQRRQCEESYEKAINMDLNDAESVCQYLEFCEN